MVTFDPWYRANRCIIMVTLATGLLCIGISCGVLSVCYPDTQGFMQYLPVSITDMLTGILLESALCKQGTSWCLLQGPGHLPPSQQRVLSQRCTCKTQRHAWLVLWQWSSLLLLKHSEHCHSSGLAEVPMSTTCTLTTSFLSCVSRDIPANLLGQVISSADKKETQ